ncbi:MAG: 4-alpha-glucanotransferase, partial [Clostridia bacterium]|nr:4-alpha-glucanotransferase [Clostridia bacterium]
GEYADFGLFMSLKVKFGYVDWTKWDEEFKVYDERTVSAFIQENREEIEFWQFTQYLFLKQWFALKEYANGKGVQMMGDMPIYVSADSVEMWKYKRDLFLLDENGELSSVAGVPPDAFSEDGQLWGNPVYDWSKMKKDGYAWWKERIDYAFRLFDIVRIDHFRGFDRFYAIPKNSDTAKVGEWLDGPKAELFKGRENLGVVAEDLGTIDDGVRTLMKETGYPGIKVMLFGLNGDPASEHKPSNFQENSFAYTGTHDNPTTVGYLQSLTTAGKELVKKDLLAECEKLNVEYLGDGEREQCLTCIELVLASKAKATVIPYQDILAVGKEGRINFPSTVSLENWSYRFIQSDFQPATWEKLKKLIKKYGR